MSGRATHGKLRTNLGRHTLRLVPVERRHRHPILKWCHP